jgi:hypothetical protein
MNRGLVTLADLPVLAPGKNPTSTIVVARLDDRLTDPRYGRFAITQADVDGWRRNLAETFNGRVSIDADHSSDRGGGTRAVGWITGIGQEGRLVTADVEWTPRGAKAIRNEDYRHISPTFVADYGDKHGKALIGAALTNRPVLRKGMPCLSLSRDRFDDVATPRKRKKKTMTKLSKPELVTLSRSTDEEIKRLYARATPKQLRKAVGMCLARGDTARARAGLAPASTGSALSPDAVITLAQYAPAGAAYAGTTDWGAPADGVRRQPPGLDDSGRALHALIANRAVSTGQHYFAAMADVTGQPSYLDTPTSRRRPSARTGRSPSARTRTPTRAHSRSAPASAGRMRSRSSSSSASSPRSRPTRAPQTCPGSIRACWPRRRARGARRTGIGTSVARPRPGSSSARSGPMARTPSSSRCGSPAPSRAATSSARWPPSCARRRSTITRLSTPATSTRPGPGRTAGARARSTRS